MSPFLFALKFALKFMKSYHFLQKSKFSFFTSWMSSLSPPTTWSKSSLSTGSLSPTGSRGRSLSPLRGNLGSSPSASQPERLYIIDDSSDEGLTEDKDVETVVGAEVRDSD